MAAPDTSGPVDPASPATPAPGVPAGERPAPQRTEQPIERLLPQASEVLRPLLRRLADELEQSPASYDDGIVQALVLFAEEADRRLGEEGDLRDVLDAGSTLRPRDFSQPGWTVDTVNNAERIFFTTVRVVLNEPTPRSSVPAPPPPPADGPEFRKAVATTLLNKLAYRQNEINWLDETFVELTAIVEDVDGYPATGRRSLLRRRGRYATRPLTQVLADPETDLVLLQGAPGAGKSVALRQHAKARLSDIRDGRTPDAPLPLYVNLRELKAKPHEINAQLLRKYVVEQTASRGSTELTAYFAHCFDEDVRQRRVTLLFDSFDEIPAILGSATVDKALKPYVDTVIEFVGGGGRCIVASREYKGPRAVGWTRLQILGLSPAQQEDFLHRAGLDRSRIDLIQPLLTDPRHGFAVELQNPLSLSLLADYVRTRNVLPDRPSALFESYVGERLGPALLTLGLREGTEERIVEQRRTEDFLAEFAFRLTSSRGELSVDEQSYLDDIEESAGGDRHARDRLLGVLRESRLLIQLPEYSGRRRISFGHRRVQQYFASQYVAGHPSAVPVRELATHGKWRETAVTVLQVGSAEVTGPLLAELAKVLAAEWDRYQETETGSREQHHSRSAYEAAAGAGPRVPSAHASFQWSSDAVHCLELLTAAFHGRLDRPPASVEELVASLVSAAWERGSVSDRKFAVDCLPLLSQATRERYIDLAFSGESNWIRATALRDCATLPALSPAIARSIRRLLITMLNERSLAAESHAVDVDLQRLRRSDDLVRVRRVISRTPLGLSLLCALHALVGLAISPTWWSLRAEVLWWWLFPFFIFWWFQSSRPLSYGAAMGRGRRLVERVARRLGWQMPEIEADTIMGLAVMAAGVNAGWVVGWGIARIVTDHVATGVAHLALYAPLSVATLLWGPSVLYLAYYGTSARELSTGRLILAIAAAARIKEHPIRRLSALDWLRFVLLAVGRYVLTSGPFLLLYYLLSLAGPTGRTISLAVAATLAAIFPLIFLVASVREFRSHRRVRRAVRRGSQGNTQFFENMFSLQNADEAAEYVQLVRGSPALGSLGLDQHQVRACIGLLQNGAESSADNDGHNLCRLVKWQGNQGLIDQLGRLDEQLRAR
ncbi:NACHT domain-containing protein [Streptomyces sp. NPDC046870]|uniref:NACHT domain-containing protein n=1 Tax=Streptomyces sp. NPDC046870 TaxID=3155135 RepID=UPI0034521C27